jgi:hypothetical protein
MATPEEIEHLAQQLHLEISEEAKRGHRQGIVPWDQLGESFKASVRRIAQAKLDAGGPA